MAQQARAYKTDPLEKFRNQVRELIKKNYKTVDEFCLVEDFHKSTMSRFLNPSPELGKRRTEYQISTLYRLAEVFGKRLVIELK